MLVGEFWDLKSIYLKVAKLEKCWNREKEGIKSGRKKKKVK